MPLLMCPNCDTGMKHVARNEVEIDMCPSCRGVWLDRGELEKLLQPVRESAAMTVPPVASARERQPVGRERGQNEHYDDDRRVPPYRRRKRNSLFEMFEIFD